MLLQTVVYFEYCKKSDMSNNFIIYTLNFMSEYAIIIM